MKELWYCLNCDEACLIEDMVTGFTAMKVMKQPMIICDNSECPRYGLLSLRGQDEKPVGTKEKS